MYKQTFFGVYPYRFTPRQLGFLADCVRSLSAVPGSFVEAGCLRGATTVFLNKVIQEEGVSRSYYAIDTFSGFVPEHARHEIELFPNAKMPLEAYSNNKKRWFDKTMRLHGLSRVESIEADITTVDFAMLAPIAFCLVDVNLYLPVKDVLPKLCAAMAKGGMVIVTECNPAGVWNGALQAYDEFLKERGIAREVVNTLGVLRS